MSLYEENAEVLANLARGGCNLATPRRVDFICILPSRVLAEVFAEASIQAGFDAQVDEVAAAGNSWDVTVSKTMTPTCDAITHDEQKLDSLVHTYGGRTDGWGFLDA